MSKELHWTRRQYLGRVAGILYSLELEENAHGV